MKRLQRFVRLVLVDLGESLLPLVAVFVLFLSLAIVIGVAAVLSIVGCALLQIEFGLYPATLIAMIVSMAAGVSWYGVKKWWESR